VPLERRYLVWDISDSRSQEEQPVCLKGLKLESMHDLWSSVVRNDVIWENVGSAKRRIISKTVEETPMHGKAEA